MNASFHLEFITPLFSRGAYEDRPEIRAASVRGQLHWWLRALAGNYHDEKAIFGGVHGGAAASKVVVRVSSVTGTIGSVNTLPHKGGGQASPKAAFQIGTRFDLHLLTRLGELDQRLQTLLDRTLETWLLLGTLGFRSTRAAGSFRWEQIGPPAENRLQPPTGFAAYEARCAELLAKAPLRCALLAENYATAESARRVVSDTLGGRDDHPGKDDLARLNDPLA